jgi:hypothetical protein
VAEAARVAWRAVAEHLSAHPGLELVRWTLFSEADLAAYEQAAAPPRG